MTPIYDQLCAALGSDPLERVEWSEPRGHRHCSHPPTVEAMRDCVNLRIDIRRRAPRRFRIYRLPNLTAWEGQTYALWPWVLQDRENPSNLPRFAGMGDAVAGMDAVLREEERV